MNVNLIGVVAMVSVYVAGCDGPPAMPKAEPFQASCDNPVHFAELKSQVDYWMSYEKPGGDWGRLRALEPYVACLNSAHADNYWAKGLLAILYEREGRLLEALPLRDELGRTAPFEWDRRMEAERAEELRRVIRHRLKIVVKRLEG